jgi:hypothetical protein
VGATAHYKSISEGALQALKAHPWLVEAFVCWQPRDMRISPFADHLSAGQRVELMARLSDAAPVQDEELALALGRRHATDLEAVRPKLATLRAEWTAPGLDIDKTWRRILAGLERCSPETARVVTRAVSSGTILGPDLGYAPAEFHEVHEVAELAAALPVALAECRSRGADCADELEYVRDYYVGAAADGKAMLLYLM